MPLEREKRHIRPIFDLPAVQRLCEFPTVLERALGQLLDGIEQPVNTNTALILGLPLCGEQRHQLLLECVRRSQRLPDVHRDRFRAVRPGLQ